MQRLAAALARDAGDYDAAHAWLVAHDRWQEWGCAVIGRAEGQLEWASLHRALGDDTTARVHAERALALVAAPRQPHALLLAHRFLGELDTAAGERARARRHLDESLALAHACGSPYERGLSLLALAAFQLVEDRTAARATLAEARGLLAPLGAVVALARLDTLVHACEAARTTFPAAVRPRQSSANPGDGAAQRDDERQPGASSHPALAGLTGRQREVLRLIALGRTNQQIATALSLSEKTIERHVTNILRKTHLTNRIAVALLAERAGLVAESTDDKSA